MISAPYSNISIMHVHDTHSRGIAGGTGAVVVLLSMNHCRLIDATLYEDVQHSTNLVIVESILGEQCAKIHERAKY